MQPSPDSDRINQCRVRPNCLLKESGFEVVHSEHFRVRWIWGMMRFVCRRTPG
jgi:hypothetical protein